MSGSAAAINRVLSDCGLPTRDPREEDSRVWRRAVDDIDQLSPDAIRGLQSLLGAVNENVGLDAEAGQRGPQTYRALSEFYAGYWVICADEEQEPLSASCARWRNERRYNIEADYPKGPVELLLEVQEARSAAARRAATPSMITNPDWVRRPGSDDMARFYPSRAHADGTEGSVTIECTAQENGRLTDCSVVNETPTGAGFGRASLQLASRFQMRPQTRDGSPIEGARVRVPLNWSLSETTR